jgi:hypothetical protein
MLTVTVLDSVAPETVTLAATAAPEIAFATV